MATLIPSALTQWIDKHEGIVQPYALSQLVEIWVEAMKTSSRSQEKALTAGASEMTSKAWPTDLSVEWFEAMQREIQMHIELAECARGGGEILVRFTDCPESFRSVAEESGPDIWPVRPSEQQTAFRFALPRRIGIGSGESRCAPATPVPRRRSWARLSLMRTIRDSGAPPCAH